MDFCFCNLMVAVANAFASSSDESDEEEEDEEDEDETFRRFLFRCRFRAGGPAALPTMPAAIVSGKEQNFPVYNFGAAP